MGIAERKERQKAELREQILVAAREIVLEQGFEQLSMRKIAEAIEYSPATIYLHFASRDEIALELVREGFADMLAALGPATLLADPIERLRDIGRRYVRFGLENPLTYRLIFMEDPKFSNSVIAQQLDAPGEPGNIAFEVLERTVEELVANGIFRPIDPEVASQLLWSGVHGMVSLRLACVSSANYFQDIESLTERFLEVMENGFRAQPLT
jgi:AcrR family transcriptional regulator